MNRSGNQGSECSVHYYGYWLITRVLFHSLFFLLNIYTLKQKFQYSGLSVYISEHNVKSSLIRNATTRCPVSYSSNLGTYSYKTLYLFGNNFNHCLIMTQVTRRLSSSPTVLVLQHPPTVGATAFAYACNSSG